MAKQIKIKSYKPKPPIRYFTFGHFSSGLIPDPNKPFFIRKKQNK